MHNFCALNDNFYKNLFKSFAYRGLNLRCNIRVTMHFFRTCYSILNLQMVELCSHLFDALNHMSSELHHWWVTFLAFSIFHSSIMPEFGRILKPTFPHTDLLPIVTVLWNIIKETQNIWFWSCKSSHQRCSVKKGNLKNFAKLTETGK